MRKKQIRKEIKVLELELEKIERNEMLEKIDILNNVLKDFCDKHAQYGYAYDKEIEMLTLDTMYNFNGARDMVLMKAYPDHLYITPYFLSTRYWEHKPRCIEFGVAIDYNMPNEYFENKVLKILRRVHQWHRARPLDEKYKAFKYAVYQ